MPIHDQGYRRYLGGRDAVGRGWQVIMRAGIGTVLSKRRFLALLLLAWAPFLVRAVQIYVARMLPQASFLAPRAETFREFVDQQSFFVFLFTLFVGSGLIANDRRANALQVYLSKPLSRFEYVAGKFATLFALLVFVTFVPAMALLLIELLVAGSFSFLRQNAFLVPAITLYTLTEVLLACTTMLALSSLSKNGRFVAVMYTGLVFFTRAMFEALREATGSSRFAFLSPSALLGQLGDVMFRLEPRYELPIGVAAATVVLLIGASLLILQRRVRGVDIVT